MLYYAMLFIGYLACEFCLMVIYYVLTLIERVFQKISDTLIQIGTDLENWAEAHMKNESE